MTDIVRLLDACFSGAHTGFAVLDLQFNFLHVNRAFAAHGDRPPESYYGRNFFELFPSDVQPEFERARDSGQATQIVTRPAGYFDGPRAPTSHWGWSLDPILDEAKQVTCIVLAVYEVTEKMRAEQRELQNARLLRTISRAQELYIRDADLGEVCRALLADLLQLTGSEFGFVGDMVQREDGLHFTNRATCDLGWDEASRTACAAALPFEVALGEFEVPHGAALLRGDAVITNSPRADAFARWLPRNSPPLRSFAGIPVRSGAALIGLIGLGNRVGGFDLALVEGLQPLVRVYAQLFDAFEADRRARETLESLADSEDRFRRLSELSLEGVLIHQEGIILDANAGSERMFGYAPGELVGMNLLRLSPPEFHEQIISKIKEASAEPYESCGLRKDGTVFPGEIHARTITFGGRTARCVVMRDLTERKKIEAELRRHRELLEERVEERTRQIADQAEIIDQTRTPIVSFDLEGRITSWNRGAAERLGYTAAEAIGQPFAFVCVDGSPQPWNEPVARPAERSSLETESILRHKSGERINVFLSLTCSLDGSGQPKGWILTAVDITAQKRSEQKLQQSESQYRALFELSQDAVMTLDEAAYKDCNQATLDMFGLPDKAAFVGRTPADLSPATQPGGEASITAAERHVALAFQHGRHSFEWTHRRTNGETFAAEVHLKPIALQGRRVIQGIVHDITDRKRAEAEIIAAKEEAEFANNAKSEFMSRMSHELRTPLNAILGFGQLLQFDDDNLSQSQKDSISYMLSGGRHLLQLIDEILDIAKVDSGNMRLDIQSVDFDKALRGALLFVRPLAAAREVTVQVGDGRGVFVLADEQRLRQVLVNLLSNAIKFNVKGGRVDVDAEQRGDGRIRVSITDCGVGIDELDRNRVFEPFVRVGRASGDTEGSGIGLAITRRLIELMEGRIDFESRREGGTTFWFELPAGAPDREARDVSGPRPLRRFDPRFDGLRALYVEDDPASRQLMRRIFEEVSRGELVTADSAEAGLEIALERELDLVLLDLHLPDMDGLTALARLKGDDRTAALPVIAVTAAAMHHQVEQARDHPFAAYITKPVEIATLVQVIATALETPAQLPQ